MNLTVRTNIEIKDELIRGMLADAFDGGSSYWCMVVEDNLKIVALSDKSVKYRSDLPLSDTGYIVVRDNDGYLKKPFTVNKHQLEIGLLKFVEKEPKRFARCIDEGGDAEDADVMFQYVVFGKIVFG